MSCFGHSASDVFCHVPSRHVSHLVQDILPACVKGFPTSSFLYVNEAMFWPYPLHHYVAHGMVRGESRGWVFKSYRDFSDDCSSNVKADIMVYREYIR